MNPQTIELQGEGTPDERLVVGCDLEFITPNYDRISVPKGWAAPRLRPPRWLARLFPAWHVTARADVLRAWLYRTHRIGARCITRQEADAVYTAELDASGHLNFWTSLPGFILLELRGPAAWCERRCGSCHWTWGLAGGTCLHPGTQHGQRVPVDTPACHHYDDVNPEF